MKTYQHISGWRVNIVSDDGETVKFHQAGGGFMCSSEHAEFHAEFTEALAPVMRRGTVTADFLDGEPLACWSDGSLWNGWAMPYLERADVDLLIAIDIGPLKWEGDNVVALMNDDPEDIETYEPQTIEGVTVWPVGAGSWCWNAVEFPEETP